MGNRNGRTVGKYTFIFISYLAARDATSSRAREGDAHSSREALKGEELSLIHI